MPLGPQPRRADGTFAHPYSALHLRLALATFGVVVCVAGGILVWTVVHAVPIAIAFFAFAALAVVDIGVILVRLRRGRRADETADETADMTADETAGGSAGGSAQG